MCSTTTGTAACECQTGYTGAACDECADGYQDEDANGTCEPTCETSALDCGDFGACMITAGAPACACDTGYTGDSCDGCADGYQDNDNDGVCEADCATAAPACTNQQVCSDASGAAVCVCGPGDPCVVCPTGEQDEDGNGVCTASCGEATWWDFDWRNRLHLEINNTGSDTLTTGTTVTASLAHAAEVTAGRSLASGDDVRLVYVDDTGNAVELARDVEGDGWNTDGALVTFALQNDIATQTAAGNYWLYWNNAGAQSPPLATFQASPEWAISDDDGATLDCTRRAGSFYSIQLRQLAPNSTQYEVYANEHTGDSSAFGRIVVKDTAGAVVFQKQYGELGGSCCSPVVDGNTADAITIPQTEFTVELTSDEFSGSNRYFGCTAFATRHPNSVGSNTRSYTVGPLPRDAATVCERGTAP